MAQRVLLCTRFLTQQAFSSKLRVVRPTLSSSLPLVVNRSLSDHLIISSSTSSSSSSRWFQSTPLVQEDAKAKKKAAKAAAKAKLAAAEAEKEEQPPQEENEKNDTNKENGHVKKKEDEEEEDDDVPVYQNPLHHENAEYVNDNKVYPEDFQGDNEEMPVVPLPPMETGEPGEIPASPELHALADEILQLNILEMNELVTNIADHFGFEDDGAMMDMGGGSGGSGGAAAEEAPPEEKTAFDLKLTGYDKKAKIKVIKEVRAMSGLGLKEAKELVEGAPKVVKKEMKKEEAEELKAKLEAVGATVELV